MTLDDVIADLKVCIAEYESSLCPKCKGKGWYSYDENHGKPCEVCCTHSRGRWQLKENYGINNGKWCCLAGCGHKTDNEDGTNNLITLQCD